MNNRIGPTVKHVVWNVLHNFLVCHKHNSLPHGPIQPSSHSTKELHDQTYKALPNSFLPWPVLRPVPGPCVRVELFDDGRLLLDRVGPCAGAGHGGAEEDVDDEHDEEEDAERDAEVEHPRGTWSAVAANAFHVWKWTTLRFRFRVKFQVSGPVDSSAHSILQP